MLRPRSVGGGNRLMVMVPCERLLSLTTGLKQSVFSVNFQLNPVR